MKSIKWLLAIVAVSRWSVLVGGWLLSPTFQVSRSVVVAAPADRIYPLVADPRHWTSGRSGTCATPAMHVDYFGAPEGSGAGWSWKSESQGDGRMTFTAAEPGRRVVFELFFPDFGTTSTGDIRLDPQGAGTRVTWSMNGDMGSQSAVSLDGAVRRQHGRRRLRGGSGEPEGRRRRIRPTLTAFAAREPSPATGVRPARPACRRGLRHCAAGSRSAALAGWAELGGLGGWAPAGSGNRTRRLPGRCGTVRRLARLPPRPPPMPLVDPLPTTTTPRSPNSRASSDDAGLRAQQRADDDAPAGAGARLHRTQPRGDAQRRPRHQRTEAARRPCRQPRRRLPLLRGAHDPRRRAFRRRRRRRPGRLDAVWQFRDSDLFSAAERRRSNSPPPRPASPAR